MQQGGGSQSHQYLTGGASAAAAAADQPQQSSQMEVEEASPISSRPPASTENLEDFMPLGSGGGFSEMDTLATAAAGDDGDRGGGAGGNRWPRHETLALLRIRSEMDAAFREATVKSPLWEDISRKLAELGYKRSAKKCKEKFENVDKYYKRTKEGRAGRHDGKSYKFFSELEALHNISASQAPPPTIATTAPSTTGVINIPGVGYSSPMPISSIRPLLPTTSISPAPPLPQSHLFPTAAAAAGALSFAASPMALDFSSDSSSSSPETEDDEEDNEGSDMEGEPSNVAGSSRKRKRSRGGSGSRRRMMELFERLMKQVIQKQEAMQQKFLEAIEKREQDRLIREEAWRRQEMAMLAREHEIMARERAVSASRDASIMAFLQKVTGQTIQLPTPPQIATIPTPAAPLQQSAPVPQPIHIPAPPQQPIPSYQRQKPQQQTDRPPQVHPVNVEAARHYQPAVSGDVVLAAVPEQQVRPHESVGGDRSSEPPSSRWPKTEVLALIRLRSGLESRYQEAGPKGPLWEEISAGMQRMGHKRSAKRCKEKWENINKYYKKVKESNKKRPEDSKTCPYYHELDALYRKKILGGSSSGSIGGSGGAGSSAQQVQHRIDAPVSVQELQPGSLTVELQAKDGDSSGQGSGTMEEGNGGAEKPEDTVKELIGGDSHQHKLDLQQQHVKSTSGDAHKNAFALEHCHVGLGQVEDEEEVEEDIMEGDDDDVEDGGGGGEEEEEDEEQLQEERKTAYKIEYQQRSRQNAAGPPNGGGSSAAPATTSFMAMVQ